MGTHKKIVSVSITTIKSSNLESVFFLQRKFSALSSNKIVKKWNICYFSFHSSAYLNTGNSSWLSTHDSTSHIFFYHALCQHKRNLGGFLTMKQQCILFINICLQKKSLFVFSENKKKLLLTENSLSSWESDLWNLLTPHPVPPTMRVTFCPKTVSTISSSCAKTQV